ncbi:Hypothetical predicted protein [Paramuricea clavata]|uniref:Uncharacterized protein n=1 Tax=Paramuricea clavata TaxID=317549 RepID=A0A6S7GH81_PARCT|nr:Hypothetical predicted protein [Paramuricea clavata]
MGAGNSTREIPYSVQETVPAITKRTIGKLIVKYCGNEGRVDDPDLYVTLRQMLQATITKLDAESPETWKNAEIVIYDQRGNDFCIRSGDAENKFVVQLDEKDEINIMCTDRKKQSIYRWVMSFKIGMPSFLTNPAAIENSNASTSPTLNEDAENSSQQTEDLLNID